MTDELDQAVLALPKQMRSLETGEVNNHPGAEGIEQVGVEFCVSIRVEQTVWQQSMTGT